MFIFFNYNVKKINKLVFKYLMILIKFVRGMKQNFAYRRKGHSYTVQKYLVILVYYDKIHQF